MENKTVVCINIDLFVDVDLEQVKTLISKLKDVVRDISNCNPAKPELEIRSTISRVVYTDVPIQQCDCCNKPYTMVLIDYPRDETRFALSQTGALVLQELASSACWEYTLATGNCVKLAVSCLQSKHEPSELPTLGTLGEA